MVESAVLQFGEPRFILEGEYVRAQVRLLSTACMHGLLDRGMDGGLYV